MPPPPRIVVVGLGRLGAAVAHGLRKARWPVHVRTRSPSGRREARRLHLPEADARALTSADLVLFTVPDDALGAVAVSLAPELGRRTGMVHCAGSLTLEVLARACAGRPTGSFHPLVAVSGWDTPLAGHFVALATRSRALAPLLGTMAQALALEPFRVPEDGRTLYHAGAVLSAAGLVALLDGAVSAWSAAGIDPRTSERALVSLMRSALEGVSARGRARAVTGPVARGDAAVVQRHLAALDRDLRGLYAVLGQRALALVRKELARPAARALERSLAGAPRQP